MKKILFAALLAVALCSTAFSRQVVASGKTNTSLGDYKIEVADKPAIINGEECNTYVISYQNSPMEVTVVVKKSEKCKNYIVLSDKLSIQYVCNESYFGVQKLDKTFETEGFKTSDEELNRSEYFHQKLIAPGKRTEIEAASLIASYFPMLLKSAEMPLALK